jgi:hypothetical protein
MRNIAELERMFHDFGIAPTKEDQECQMTQELASLEEEQVQLVEVMRLDNCTHPLQEDDDAKLA